MGKGGEPAGPPCPGTCSETHGSSIPGAQVCQLVLSFGLPTTHTPVISQSTGVPRAAWKQGPQGVLLAQALGGGLSRPASHR